MPSTEVIKSGCAYRVLAALQPVTWNKLSLWSKASDVEFDDGKTAQSKLGAISGITSDPATSSATYAVSAQLNKGMNGETYVNIATSDWGAGASVAGKTRYACTKKFTKVYRDHPIISFAGDGVMTDAQQDAWTCIDAVGNRSNNTITFYTTNKSVALKINVMGAI